MTIPTTVAQAEDQDAVRWREWQHAYALDSRKGAFRARIVFTALLTAVGVWLGLQILAR